MTQRTFALVPRSNSTLRTLFALLVVGSVSLFSWSASAQLRVGCPGLDNAYGPFDYTNANDFRTKLPVVEQHHFDSGVEALRGHRGKPHQLAGDIDYTLRAFPNHHKALYTAIRYDLSKAPNHRRRLPQTTECYFQKAMTFRPNDGKVRLLYGLYKSRINQFEEAKQQFAEAERLMPNSAEVQYNIGLVLAKNGEFDQAYQHAIKAYDMGYPLPGLRNILRRNGKWPDTKTD